jgi:hypothetical protein
LNAERFAVIGCLAKYAPIAIRQVSCRPRNQLLQNSDLLILRLALGELWSGVSRRIEQITRGTSTRSGSLFPALHRLAARRPPRAGPSENNRRAKYYAHIAGRRQLDVEPAIKRIAVAISFALEAT